MFIAVSDQYEIKLRRSEICRGALRDSMTFHSYGAYESRVSAGLKNILSLFPMGLKN